MVGSNVGKAGGGLLYRSLILQLQQQIIYRTADSRSINIPANIRTVSTTKRPPRSKFDTLLQRFRRRSFILRGF